MREKPPKSRTAPIKAPRKRSGTAMGPLEFDPDLGTGPLGLASMVRCWS
jgi:hypothetical protein